MRQELKNIGNGAMGLLFYAFIFYLIGVALEVLS